eukprot:1134686_1
MKHHHVARPLTAYCCVIEAQLNQSSQLILDQPSPTTPLRSSVDAEPGISSASYILVAHIEPVVINNYNAAPGIVRSLMTQEHSIFDDFSGFLLQGIPNCIILSS